MRRSTINATAQPELVRVGIVGAGNITRNRHIPGFLALEGVEITAVCNRTVPSSRAVADEFDIGTIHEDWRALVADSRVDAVLVGTWPNMHHPITLTALSEGKHVLCEARMAMDSAESREMLAASRSRPDVVAQLVPAALSFGVDETVRRFIDVGLLGTLLSIDVEYRTGEFPDPNSPLHWREDRRLSGNNVLALGIWYETLMRWVGRATSVFAMGKVSNPRRHTSSGAVGARIPDHVDVIARMENGSQARMQMSAATGLTTANSATLFGSEGILHFAEQRLTFARRGDQRLQSVDIPEDEAAEWRVEDDFIDAIRGKKDVELTDFETGLRYMEFTDAVWTSMEQGCVVDIPPDPGRPLVAGSTYESHAENATAHPKEASS